MEHLIRVLAAALRKTAWLLPPERRQWAEAVGAEAGQVPAGWPRLRWLAGGLWLAMGEAQMMRKAVYWLGTGAVAAAAAWVVWLSWHTSPAADSQTVTDRVRVLVGVAALVVLPWVGRRHGWFGPAGRSLTARLVRVAGCAAACGLGLAVIRMDSHVGPGPHGPGPFSLLREIAAVVVVGAAVVVLAVFARGAGDDPLPLWAVAVSAGLLVFVLVPLQALAIGYAAGIFAATSRRSPVTSASLAAGTITGLAAGLAAAVTVYGLATPTDRYVDLQLLAVLTTTFLFAALAGAAAAWLLPGTGDPQELRLARSKQGMLAGTVAGAVSGLLLTNLFVVAVFMLVGGPLLGLAGGAAGGAAGAAGADHPRRSLPVRSWAAGLFVRF
jgi:hypothetical protein